MRHLLTTSLPYAALAAFIFVASSAPPSPAWAAGVAESLLAFLLCFTLTTRGISVAYLHSTLPRVRGWKQTLSGSVRSLRELSAVMARGSASGALDGDGLPAFLRLCQNPLAPVYRAIRPWVGQPRVHAHAVGSMAVFASLLACGWPGWAILWAGTLLAAGLLCDASSRVLLVAEEAQELWGQFVSLRRGILDALEAEEMANRFGPKCGS